jgi:1-aminocyclopropane-1-carboxylate deaminase
MTQISKLNFNNIDAFFSKQARLQACEFEWNGFRHKFSVLREDLLHPALSGNKFRKLYGWLKLFYERKLLSIESMGGAHSNHLSALVYACITLNIPCKIYVPIGAKSALLDKIEKTDVSVEMISREKFRELRSKEESLSANTLWVPEGGKGEASECGFETVAEQLLKFNYTCVVSAGTGSTALAMAKYGVATEALLAVKDRSVLEKMERNGINVWPTYAISKFGKLHLDALALAKEFYSQTGILLDPVYQAKGLLMALNNQILNESTVFVHTGGLQGWMGYQNELEVNFPEKEKKEIYANFDAIFTS